MFRSALWKILSSCFSVTRSFHCLSINNILNISQSEDQHFPKKKDGEIAQENTLGKKADQDEVVLSAACEETKPRMQLCLQCRLTL